MTGMAIKFWRDGKEQTLGVKLSNLDARACLGLRDAPAGGP